ncbi:MAG: DUF86 domain-containing protein [Gemmatimonadota bacterium]
MSPLDREVVRRRLAGIAENLERLGEIVSLTLEQYRGDWQCRKATERVLQEIVEAAVDINQHLLVSSGAGPAPDYRQSFLEIGRLGIIPADLALALAPSAGLRHRLVHEYDEIDDAIVLTAVRSARDLFPAYLEAVERHLGAD